MITSHVIEPFRVVRILNEYEILVNAGRSVVSRGDSLEIYVPGKDIIDPKTKQSLGVLDFIKATVIVHNVFEQMCICKSDITDINSITRKVNSLMTGMSVPLNINSFDIEPVHEGIDEVIRIGDPVRKV